jgi:hypothetical protein
MAQRKVPGTPYPAHTLRLLLVNPALPESFWSFRWALEQVKEGDPPARLR